MDAIDALLDKLRNIVELHNGNTDEMREAVEAHDAAIRKECAKLAESYKQVDVANAIRRTARPAKAQEGA